jgi:tryptophan synthase alpha chain
VSPRLAQAFLRARAEGRAALVTYVMAGDPGADASLSIALACAAGGADVIELGVPFSDPIADGPTIQRAASRALASGTTLAGCLELASRLRARTDVPIVLMGYANPILAMGEARFVERARACGVDGLIVPDLPPEEAGALGASARASGVALAFLLAPTSDDARVAAATQAATGFVYYVSVAGVTGAWRSVPVGIAPRLASIRARSPVPVVVGFGVSTPAQAGELGRSADGVVVGSALVSLVERDGPLAPAAIEALTANLRRALDPPPIPPAR